MAELNNTPTYSLQGVVSHNLGASMIRRVVEPEKLVYESAVCLIF